MRWERIKDLVSRLPSSCLIPLVKTYFCLVDFFERKKFQVANLTLSSKLRLSLLNYFRLFTMSIDGVMFYLSLKLKRKNVLS